MAETAGRDDVYSSFMNLLSLQWMFKKIVEYNAVDGFEIMDKFNPKKLKENVDVFNQALNKYLTEYEKVGIVYYYRKREISHTKFYRSKSLKHI